jgi:hypothetical protein
MPKYVISGKMIKTPRNLLQDDYMEALNKLNLTVTKAYKVNPNIKFEVFIHKVDGLGDDFKMESQRDIHQRATDDLADSGTLFMTTSTRAIYSVRGNPLTHSRWQYCI